MKRTFFLFLLIPFATLAATLAPHRATYKLQLHFVSPRSPIVDVSGVMRLETKQTDDGWSVEQHSTTVIFTDDDEAQTVKWTYLTVEEPRQFSFTILRHIDNELAEETRGKAKREGARIAISIKDTQEPFASKLDGAVLFPTQHLKSMLDAIAKEEKIFSASVFDGSDIQGPHEMNAFIGAVHHTEKEALVKNPLLDQVFWPIKLSIYNTGNTSDTPDLESLLEIQKNGVMQAYIIDYGDFKIKATLEKIEFLSE